MAETGKAKTAIRRALREADKQKHIVMGQELARAAFEHVGKKATDKALSTAAKKMRIPNKEELLARLGSAELRSRDVVQSVYPELASDQQPVVDSRRAVIGLAPGQSFNRSPCCQALPGERIIGIAAMVRVLLCIRLIVRFWSTMKANRIFGLIYIGIQENMQRSIP